GESIWQRITYKGKRLIQTYSLSHQGLCFDAVNDGQLTIHLVLMMLMLSKKKSAVKKTIDNDEEPDHD
ncbi:MAG: hypothetical protein KDK59_11260, partial [Simkania sp.]|nr:hypothetical protein [Simkania sp.]